MRSCVMCVDCSHDKVKKNAGDGIVNTEISDDSKAISDHTVGEVMDTTDAIEIKEDIVTDKTETQKKIIVSHF